MPYYDRAVPPGGRGNIKIVLRTRGRSGDVRKSAKIVSNDPNWPQAFLGIRVFVKPVITLSQLYLNFYLKEGENVAKEVEITAKLDNPLALSPLKFNLDGKLIYRMEEIEKGKRFRIRFESVPGPVESYRGFLRLKTNYPEKPEITIWIWGHVREKQDEGSRT